MTSLRSSNLNDLAQRLKVKLTRTWDTPKHRPGGGSSLELTPEVLTFIGIQWRVPSSSKVYKWRSVMLHRSTPGLIKFLV